MVEEKPIAAKRKRPRTAVLLALVLGIIGPMGVGHVYVGKRGRGMILLIIGIILAILTWGRFFLGFIKQTIGTTGAIIIDLVFTAIWILQAYDAYRLAKRANA